MDLSLRELLSIDPSHFTIEERENIVRWIRSGKTGLSEEQLHAIKRKFCHGEWQREENRRKEAQADKLKKSEERRWERLTSPGPRDGVPYRVSHADLAMLARRWPPPNPGNRVTDFTDWIYRLYRPQPPLGALGRGKRDETEIAARKPLKETRNWRLLHDGTGDKSANALKISELCVNGRPMRGSPDFVFEHRDSGQVLIVEIAYDGDVDRRCRRC